MTKTLSPIERAHELSHFAGEFSKRVAQGVVYEPVQPDGSHPYAIESNFRPDVWQSTGQVPQEIATAASRFEQQLADMSPGEVEVLHTKFDQMARGLGVVNKSLEHSHSMMAHHVTRNIEDSLPRIERFVKASAERLATLECTTP